MSREIAISQIKITERFREYPGAIVKEGRLIGVDTDLFDKQDLEDLQDLADSIKLIGLLHPIVLDDGDTLVAGMRRLCAYVMNEEKAIEVSRLGELTELQLRIAELEENVRRVNLRWNDQVRHIAEIDRLKREEYGEATSAPATHAGKTKGAEQQGWSQEKTAALVGKDRSVVSRSINLAEALNMVPQLKECKSADEAQKKFDAMLEQLATQELMKRVAEEEGTKTEKWLVNMVDEHYIVGDCIMGMRELQDDDRRLVIAEVDPPYGIDLKEKRQGRVRDSYNEIPSEDYPGFAMSVAKEVYRVLAPDAWCIWWYGHEYQNLLYNVLEHVGFKVDKIPCAWVKNKGQTNQPDRYFARGWEPFYLCRKGKPVMHKRGRLNVFVYPGVPDKRRTHDTERPFDLIYDIVTTLCLPKSGTVLVPFMGSGNTMRAAIAHGMKALGWDIDGTEQKLALTKKLLEDFSDVPEQEEGELETEEELNGLPPEEL